MSGLAIRLVQRHFYNTFAERGVLLPFTSPRLVGTRVRTGRSRDLELVVPNPSGGVGFYILNWSNIRSVARPTVHDMRLYAGVAALPALTPAAVRKASRAVLLEGLAGRAAAAAARASEAAEKLEVRLTATYLLVRLVEQIEPPQTAPKLTEDTPANFPRRAEAAIQQAAEKLRKPPQTLRYALERVGEMFNPVWGTNAPAVPRAPPPGSQVMQLVQSLESICRTISHWTPLTNEAAAQVARELSSAAQAAALCGRVIASDVARHVDNPLDLLTRMFTAPDTLLQFATRPEWALNGWEQVILRWPQDGDESTRANVLKEIAPLVPPLPKQAGEWSRLRVDIDVVAPAGEEAAATAERNDPPSRLVEATARLEQLMSVRPPTAAEKAAVA
jgi:hypothetical protein